jgi:hypothetical protein
MRAGAKCLFEDQQVEGAMDLLFVQCDRLLMELFLVYTICLIHCSYQKVCSIATCAKPSIMAMIGGKHTTHINEPESSFSVSFRRCGLVDLIWRSVLTCSR